MVKNVICHGLFVAFLLIFSEQVRAQSTLQISLLTERTGSNAQMGSAFADGFTDYLNLLNLLDDGVGGARVVLSECEIGGEINTIIQCYEATKKSDTVALSSSSVASLHALTVNSNSDQIPFLSAGQGLSVSAIGHRFPWSFVYPTTPWSQLSAILGYINTVRELRGQTIGFLFPDTDYGNEPIALLEALSKELEFEIALYPTRKEDLLDQSLQWFHIRKGQPDWIIIWDDGGAMSTVAIKRAINIRFPKDRIIGNTLSGSQLEFSSIGKTANGFLAVNYTAIGRNFPAFQKIVKQAANMARNLASSSDQVGSVAYNRGVLSAVILAEAIKVAQDQTGTAIITRTDMRYGLENIRLNQTKLSELGLSAFSADIIGSCLDHEGGAVYIQQWNGSRWEQRSEFVEPASLFSRSLLEHAAAALASEYPDWEKLSCP